MYPDVSFTTERVSFITDDIIVQRFVEIDGVLRSVLEIHKMRGSEHSRNQRHVVGLINDLLNLTRVNSGQLEYNVRDIVAHELLTASVALVEPLIAQKQLICELMACDSNIVVRGDPERVSQILVNLLSNGVKFIPPGGRLVIDCEAIGEVVLIRVSDTGIGIPMDKLDVIFEPFIQIRGAALGVDAGLGLGLAISRRLARGMQGELTVESTLGEGSRFTLALPRSSAV